MSCAHGYKFDSEITHYLYELAGISAQDEECGTTDDLGWHALFRGSFSEEFSSVIDPDVIDALDIEDMDTLTTCAGAILQEDDQGGCYSSLYDTEEELNEAWQRVQDQAEEAYGPSEDDITTEDEQSFYQYGKLYYFVGRDVDDWKPALKQKMDRDQFWPNVWVISDHGNATLIEMGD